MPTDKLDFDGRNNSMSSSDVVITKMEPAPSTLKKSANQHQYHRQLPLLTEVRNIQEKCQHPMLLMMGKLEETITCGECGSLWIR